MNEMSELEKKVVADALRWLEETEPKWELDEPMDRQEFVKDLLRRMRRVPQKDLMIGDNVKIEIKNDEVSNL